MYIYKKRPKNGGRFVFVWIAVDRSTNKVIDFQIGSRSKSTYLKLAFRLEKKYRIENLCTDDYEVYKTYKISANHHTTKAETSLVEAKTQLLDIILRDSTEQLSATASLYALWAQALCCYFLKICLI